MCKLCNLDRTHYSLDKIQTLEMGEVLVFRLLSSMMDLMDSEFVFSYLVLCWQAAAVEMALAALNLAEGVDWGNGGGEERAVVVLLRPQNRT